MVTFEFVIYIFELSEIKFFPGLMVICQEVTSYVSKCSNDVCQIIEREGGVYPLINSLMQFETSGRPTEMVVEIFQILFLFNFKFCN